MKDIFSLSIHRSVGYLCGAALIMSLSACKVTVSTEDDDDKDDDMSFEPTLVIERKLDGYQQVPMVDTDAVAYVTLEIDEDDLMLKAYLDISEVEGVVAAHIHEGYVGQNGGVVSVFEEYDEDTLKIPADYIDEETLDGILAGAFYVNVHTETYPDGEVRGQLLTDAFDIMTFELDPQQEVPATDSSAMGYGYATFNHDDYYLDLRAISTSALATAAHIHMGIPGENGGVVVGLVQEDDAGDVWGTDGPVMLTTEQTAQLLDAEYYVNWHTDAFPSGEIRGQILPMYYEMLCSLLNSLVIKKYQRLYQVALAMATRC